MALYPDSYLYTNGKFTTMDPDRPEASAVYIQKGKFAFVGTDEEAKRMAGPGTETMDLRGRSVLPGLTDSHLHLIRGGLNYSMELRWDGVPSLADGMRMLKDQVDHTPAPQWVRVVGGFTLHQFAEKRLPTLDELNAVAPDTPVFILHLYDRALLNKAALRVIGYRKDTPNPPGGEIVRDRWGNPTGLLLAKPNAGILYATLAKGPHLSPEDQEKSTILFMRELNRLGITGAIDAGGGFQNYPEDYVIINKLAAAGDLTVRIAYNLFTQHPSAEYNDFAHWSESLDPYTGDDMYRFNGGGEMLVYSAADFEDFRQVRPDMPPRMEGDLEKVVHLLAEKQWPFRLHATYDETISRALDVFEKVNADVPFKDIHWFVDHAETITPRNIDRIKALHGGIAIQHRMAYQGEFFAERYGDEAVEETPPIRRMLAAGIPVGGGTDATRVSSYNPWVCLYWLVSGKTLGGMPMYKENRLDRKTALALWTVNNAWFSSQVGMKGQIKQGQFADFIIPSDDYFSVPEEEIRFLTSDLTVLGGKIVHAARDFKDKNPPPPVPSPSWSPLFYFGPEEMRQTYAEAALAQSVSQCSCGKGTEQRNQTPEWVRKVLYGDERHLWDSFGCSCWM